MDQRETSRHWMARPMSCVGQGEHYFVGQLVNLSHDGMMVLADQSLAKELGEQSDGGSKIFNVLFQSEQGGTGKVQLEADPVWCEPTGDDHYYNVGFKLRTLSGPKQLLINHWVKYCTH